MMGVSSVTAVMVVNLIFLASELRKHRGHPTYGPPVKGGQRASGPRRTGPCNAGVYVISDLFLRDQKGEL